MPARRMADKIHLTVAVANADAVDLGSFGFVVTVGFGVTVGSKIVAIGVGDSVGSVGMTDAKGEALGTLLMTLQPHSIAAIMITKIIKIINCFFIGITFPWIFQFSFSQKTKIHAVIHKAEKALH